MKTLHFSAIGMTPLIMHNGRLADPLDEYARALSKTSSIRKKTEADHEEMARLEFMGSLYVHDGRISIPGNNLRAAVVGPGGGARQSKNGKKAAKGLNFPLWYMLEYEGPMEPDALWEAPGFRFRTKVSIGQSSVIRTRPIFDKWEFTGEVEYNEDFVDLDDVIHWLKVTGNEVGLGDWRPAKYGPYGRFKIDILG